jgi:branched-chain amino acid transport system permease protein
MSLLGKYWFLLPLGTFLLILPLVVPYVSLASEMVIFAIFAVGYDILFGYTGLLSFGHAMFFGIGAYSTALILKTVSPSVFLSLTASVLIAELAALVVGALSIRRRGIYFVMLTLAFCQMFYFIGFKWTGLTGGDSGLHGVPRPNLWLVDLNNHLNFYFFVCCIFIFSVFIAVRIVSSPFGRVLKSIKNNEDRALSIGYNTYVFKLISFMISAFFASLSGGLYAMHLNFVPLDTLSISTSGEVVVMTLVGGAGTLYGPIFGAMILVYLKHVLSNWLTYWNLILGVIFVVSVLTVRQGFLPLLKEWAQEIKFVSRRGYR